MKIETTGEWTVEQIGNSGLGFLKCGRQEIERRVDLSILHRIADAHNAALAAAFKAGASKLTDEIAVQKAFIDSEVTKQLVSKDCQSIQNR